MGSTQQIEPRWRSAPLFVAMLAVLLGTACGSGHMLARNEVPELETPDGLLASAVKSNKNVAVTLSRDADMAHCVAFAELNSTRSLAHAKDAAHAAMRGGAPRRPCARNLGVLLITQGLTP